MLEPETLVLLVPILKDLLNLTNPEVLEEAGVIEERREEVFKLGGLFLVVVFEPVY